MSSALNPRFSEDDFDSDDESSMSAPQPLTYISPEILNHLKHLNLSEYIESVKGLRAINNGSRGDILKSQLRLPDGKTYVVALKRLRFYMKEDIKFLFEKEIYVWSKLKHPNVLALLGFTFDESGYPLLVSQWMKNRSAHEYVEANPECDIKHLILGIAKGLTYLHEQGVVHSDIKPTNIVVSRSGDALICDFGCARMMAASRSLGLMSNGEKGTTRYLAYELVRRDRDGPALYSREADVWAFGMTVFELFTRQRPYNQYPREDIVILAIQNDEPPFLLQSIESDKDGFGHVLQTICQRCWAKNPKERIQMATVLQEVQTFQERNVLDTDSSNADIDVEVSVVDEARSMVNQLVQEEKSV